VLLQVRPASHSLESRARTPQHDLSSSILCERATRTSNNGSALSLSCSARADAARNPLCVAHTPRLLTPDYNSPSLSNGW
jgi:hypothetical protein